MPQSETKLLAVGTLAHRNADRAGVEAPHRGLMRWLLDVYCSATENSTVKNRGQGPVIQACNSSYVGG